MSEEEVPPKSEKVPVLVLRRLICSQVDLNVLGLLYPEPFFCGQFTSLARWNSQTIDCQFLFRLSRTRSFDWTHLRPIKANICDA